MSAAAGTAASRRWTAVRLVRGALASLLAIGLGLSSPAAHGVAPEPVSAGALPRAAAAAHLAGAAALGAPRDPDGPEAAPSGFAVLLLSGGHADLVQAVRAAQPLPHVGTALGAHLCAATSVPCGGSGAVPPRGSGWSRGFGNGPDDARAPPSSPA